SQEIKKIRKQLGEATHHKKIVPYFVECFADFNWNGYKTPPGIGNYPDGNYELEITGNKGDNFVTVNGGDDIADAGTEDSWACVIKDDSGEIRPHLVTKTNGTDKINIFPALKSKITNGVLASLHDAYLGQHYSELGYRGL